MTIGPLFDPIQLADIASKLDDAEKAHLTVGEMPLARVLQVTRDGSVVWYKGCGFTLFF